MRLHETAIQLMAVTVSVEHDNLVGEVEGMTDKIQGGIQVDRRVGMAPSPQAYSDYSGTQRLLASKQITLSNQTNLLTVQK